MHGAKKEDSMHYMIPAIWHSRKSKAMETVKRSAVARGWVVGWE